MVYLIEGARNTGKTYISSFFNVPKYKFPFSKWYGELNYSDDSRNTHDFALGKEIMLMDLNKKGFIDLALSDRGIITVFVWAILSKRISESEAQTQFNLLVSDGLFKDTRIIWVKGKNPNTRTGYKDFWDHMDGQTEHEAIIYNSFINLLIGRGVECQIVHNDFTPSVLERIKEIKNVWNIN